MDAGGCGAIIDDPRRIERNAMQIDYREYAGPTPCICL
jgi:hypothetical protein